VPVYVDGMPFADHAYDLSWGGVTVRTSPCWPLVYVSLTRPRDVLLPADAPKFPVIVDTGCTAALSIQEGHLHT
jgi:hypothetical protein